MLSRTQTYISIYMARAVELTGLLNKPEYCPTFSLTRLKKKKKEEKAEVLLVIKIVVSHMRQRKQSDWLMNNC